MQGHIKWRQITKRYCKTTNKENEKLHTRNKGINMSQFEERLLEKISTKMQMKTSQQK